MINRVVLVGRTTKDPELKTSASGNSFCPFTIAIDNRGKDAEGKKTTSFINCICYGQTAETMCKFTRKGSLIGVEGRLNQRSFLRQDGSKGSVLEVQCDSVQFLEPKGSNVENSETEFPPFEDNAVSSDSENLDSLSLPDEGIPF